ncbi:YhjD/YihY/BrkB family envelope integrity protein [Actinokineospora guangxiensis]|uniref:YhjD/YihY/BrkB family envelope integrity protein n=1 Tax=Actinokineospora guangxiensis TaxID=1490288 RepID=A0ABW0EUL7_9PSEU
MVADEKSGETKVERLRRTKPGIDHLFRANEAFTERYGNHFAASITYFSVLSLFPLLLISFALLGFVLAGQPDLLKSLQEGITSAAPENLRGLLTDLVNTAIEERGRVGLIGLLAAAYTGLGWMSNLRDALTAQWGQKHEERPFFKGMGLDLLALLGLGLAMVLSFGLSAVGSGLAGWLLDLVGLGDVGWARVVLFCITTALALGANWLIFLWVIARLPRKPVSVKSAVKGALAAAVGFELLKTIGTIYLNSVLGGPLGSLVGPIVGLLVFANLVSRFLLYVTAWTATAAENVVEEDVEAPPPAVIKPVVTVGGRPNARQAAGLLGVGAVVGLVVGKRRRSVE